MSPAGSPSAGPSGTGLGTRNRHRLAATLMLACCVSAIRADDLVGTFYLNEPGTRGSIEIDFTSIDARDVYFVVRGEAPDGDHYLHLTIYDGIGRIVLEADTTVTAREGRWGSATSYGFKPYRDAPGVWWYVADLDGKQFLSKSLVVEPGRTPPR